MPKADAPRLADSICFALDRPPTAAGLAEPARQTGARYDIAVFVRKMERLYDLLHENSRQTGRAGILKTDLSFLVTEKR